MADATLTPEQKAALRVEALKAWRAIEGEGADEIKKARAALVEKFPVLREIFADANHS